MRVALWFPVVVCVSAASLPAQDGWSDNGGFGRPGDDSQAMRQGDDWGATQPPPTMRRGARVNRLAQEINSSQPDYGGPVDNGSSMSRFPGSAVSGTGYNQGPATSPAFDSNGRMRFATSFGYGRVAPGARNSMPASASNGYGAATAGGSNDGYGSGIEPAAGENPGVGEPPIRSAQVPDIFRTPNPTPLERPNGEPYAPQLAPGQDIYQPMQPAAPEPPLPPLAPLVNMRFTDTWIGASKQNMGMNDIDTRATLAMGRTGVFVTPGYGMHFLNGPTSTDLPGTLYDAYVDIRWNKKLDDVWGFELAFTPSFYSDGHNESSDAWRFITTALGFYQINPQTQLMAGVMYLDRFDINWFPIFGVIYTGPDSDSDWRYEVVFPRPKFARRVLHADDKDGWVYLAGEFGGGAWAVQRTNGANDMVAIRDWRVMLGYETKVKDFSALSWFAEAGYVFHRQVEFRSGYGNFNPDSAGMLRFGVSY